MKKILITLDYDSTSHKVAEIGVNLAKAMNAEIILLHVISNPAFYYSQYSGMYRQVELLGDLKIAAQSFLDKTKLDLEYDSIQTLIVEGDTADKILESAKDTKADIIVMGTHSRKWFENIIMGSVAEKVLKEAIIPLFIIPTKKMEMETIGK